MDPEAVQEALQQVGEEERTILDRLLWQRPTGALRRADRAVTLAEARSPIERLLALGLLRPADSETVVLPREVALVLRGGRLVPDPVATRAPELAGGTRAERLVQRAGAGAAWALVHDVEQLVGDLDRRSVDLLRDGGVSTRDVAALGRRASLSPEQAAVLLEWASAAGLVGPDGPRLLPTARYDRWISGSGADRWLHLVRHWRASGRWPRAGSRGGAHPLGPDGELRGAVEIRQGILAVLAGQPVGRRLAPEPLTEVVAWHHPAWAERLPLAELVADVLVEAEQAGLTALGAVSPLARVAAGAELPDELAELFPEPVDRLVVQADLTAVAPGPLVPEVNRTMRLLAEQESRGGGGVYRFTEGSLRRALDAGWALAEIERWLEEHSSTGVPQPLRYLLADVARRHGSIQVMPTSAVVRCDDPAQAASLLGRPEASRLGLHAVAPGVLAATAEPDEVVQVLREVGLAPVGTDASGTALTAPPPPRAREGGGEAEPPAEPVDAVRVAELLLGREADRRARARAVDSAVDVLTRAAAARTPVVVDLVTAEGESTTRRATPLHVSPGAVRLADAASGQVFTVPLARVVGARDDTPG
nr:helicase-associated domain-containing protein [Auraticoccus cholistanensis]